MDKTGKIKFIMEIADDTVLEFPDLKLKINKVKIKGEIREDNMSMLNPQHT